MGPTGKSSSNSCYLSFSDQTITLQAPWKLFGSSSVSNGGFSEGQLFHRPEMPVKCMKKTCFTFSALLFLPRLQQSYSSILLSFSNLFLSFVFSTIVETAGKYVIFSCIFHMLGWLSTLTNSSFACWFSRKVKKVVVEINFLKIVEIN